MPREKGIQFLPLVKEVYNPVFRDFGFEIQEEAEWDGHGEYTVIASKGEMSLVFYLGLVPLFYYFDIGIKLSGSLAKKLTSDLYHQKHSIGMMAIANHLNSDYKPQKRGNQTKEELINAMEKRKEDLLQYCSDILAGDISILSDVVSDLVGQRKNSSFKAPKHN